MGGLSETLFIGMCSDGDGCKFAYDANLPDLASQMGYAKDGKGDVSQTQLLGFGVKQDVGTSLFPAAEGKWGSAILCEALAAKLNLGSVGELEVTEEVVDWVRKAMGELTWADAESPESKHGFLKALRDALKKASSSGSKVYIVFEWRLS